MAQDFMKDYEYATKQYRGKTIIHDNSDFLLETAPGEYIPIGRTWEEATKNIDAALDMKFKSVKGENG